MTTVKIRLTQERTEFVTHDIDLTPEQYQDFISKVENTITESDLAEVNEEFLNRMHNGEFPNSVWDAGNATDWEAKAGYYDGLYGEWYEP